MPHNQNQAQNDREKFEVLSSKILVLPQTDIDTDQIIPARFLTTTSKKGLGKHAFQDWRYHDDGSLIKDCKLNTDEAKSSRILVAGRNFGCGSSREHAPWALLDYGFKAVISTEIADIFKSNALKNGLLPIVVDEETHKWLTEHEGDDLTIDLKACQLRMDNKAIPFDVEPFSRICLLEGIDQLGFIQSHMDEIEAYESKSGKAA